jgi:hypothetical protein
MSNSEEVVKILAAAREHAERLTADIPLARVRDEHVRVTARANEAANILAALEEIFTTTVGAASDDR